MHGVCHVGTAKMEKMMKKKMKDIMAWVQLDDGCPFQFDGKALPKELASTCSMLECSVQNLQQCIEEPFFHSEI
jgi:hypothetical protein